MAVDAAYISAISSGMFTIGTGGTISTETFALYLTQSTREVEADLPSSIDSALKDEAISLLVCHRIEAWKGLLDINGESVPDHSYSKKSGSIDSWLIAYDRIKTTITGKKKSRGTYVASTPTDSSIALPLDYQQEQA
jgi:hypothetical protein